MQGNHDLSGVWRRKVNKMTFLGGIFHEGQIFVE
jgi:hypothetical protein